MAASPDLPYRAAPGSDPPALAGRDGELGAVRYAVGLTKQGVGAQPIVLTGLRGMGKTALMHRCVEDAKEQGGIVLYAEASRELQLGTIMRRGLEKTKKEFALIPERLKTAFNAALKVMPEAAYELPHEMGAVVIAERGVDAAAKPFVDILDDLNAAIRKHHHFLVFAIDEVQECPATDLLTIIRLVHEKTSTVEPVLFLGAGLPNSKAHLHSVRTYTERWRYFRLELLTHDDTAIAINKPAKERGVVFDDKAIDRLYEETAGYPFFIQEYASAAWLQRASNRITLADVNGIIPGVRRMIDESFYDGRFRRLTPRECAYVMALNALGPGAHAVGEVAEKLGVRSEALSSTRNQLVKKDVVFAPSGGLLEFRMPLSNRYINEHKRELQRRAHVSLSREIER